MGRGQVPPGHPFGRGLLFPNTSIARLIADGVTADIVETITLFEKTVKRGLELIGGQSVSGFPGVGLNYHEQGQGPGESEFGDELHLLKCEVGSRDEDGQRAAELRMALVIGMDVEGIREEWVL